MAGLRSWWADPIRSPNCVPSRAAVLLSEETILPNNGPRVENVYQTLFDFRHRGTLQWGDIHEPGTYSLYADPGHDLEWEFYTYDDRSHPMLNPKPFKYSDLPSGIRDLIGSARNPKVEEEGMRIASPIPFYVRLRTRDGSTGQRIVSLVKHKGATKETAVDLISNRGALTPSFPVGRMLGDEDICWIKLDLPPLFSGKPRKERLEVKNPNAIELSLALMDTNDNLLAYVEGLESIFTIEFETMGGIDAYLTVKRHTIGRTGVSISWVSPVSYLLLNKLINLYASDETGAGVLGSDEIELKLAVDGKKILSQEWAGGADTGEYWRIEQLIRNKAQATLGDVDRLGFVDEIKFELNEPDAGDHRVEQVISPIDPYDANGDKTEHLVLTVPDFWGDGKYVLTCSATKYGL